MPQALLIATRNPGKLREFRELLAEVPELELCSLTELPGMPEVVEDGESFAANASKKALEIARASSMLVLSDDSGLEVDALEGLPGVRSARYAGEGASDEQNNQKLIAALRWVPSPQRGARYRAVLALADPAGPLGEDVHLEEGVCEGRMRLEPHGQHGFGYDPYFEPRGYAQTMAELPPEEKNRISHRALAMQKMKGFLVEYLRKRSTWPPPRA